MAVFETQPSVHGLYRLPQAVQVLHTCDAMTPEALQERTLTFALAIYRFIRPLFRDFETRHIAAQLLRCSSSAASNYRAARLSRSTKEWIAKLGVVREESDESLFWLIFLQRSEVLPTERRNLDALIEEAGQLAKIFASSYRTSRNTKRPKKDGTSGEGPAPSDR